MAHTKRGLCQEPIAGPMQLGSCDWPAQGRINISHSNAPSSYNSNVFGYNSEISWPINLVLGILSLKAANVALKHLNNVYYLKKIEIGRF